ncbi:hypothetical protein [Acidiphilium sp. PM]|uniref:hypothetical protein n=1 Tax=Acidiphilium sp. PM TaxID=1043206 RepID=UPI0002145A84|nr:hypothetical protein [Acidiphilium sp. PM]EGO96110.1 Hypothetical protein APM_1064 [Acidiphilium sp. PM]
MSNRDELRILPPPFPPVIDWIEKHITRANNDFDVEALLREMQSIAIWIYMQRSVRKAPKKQQENLKRYRKLNDALRIIGNELPPLIEAAKRELSRNIVRPEVIDRVPELILAREKMLDNLKIEEELLIVSRKMQNGESFFSQVRKNIAEPWIGDASMLVSLFSVAFEKIGFNVPRETSFSERTPLIRIIREALHWIGYRGLSEFQIAQSLKRSAIAHKKRIANRRSLLEIAKIVTAESVLVGQLAPDVCPDDFFEDE